MKALATLIQKLQFVLTAIVVNPGQCPCKSVKTENDVTSSKINIFSQNLDK